MKCPYCGSIDDKVVESKQNVDGSAIRRRRECLSCHGRFTSYEHIKENPLTVIKRNKGVELFDMAKIERGIRKSLEKRPVTEDQLQAALRDIEDEVYGRSKNSTSISTEDLGELVLQHLFQLDKVAYIRFASVYKKFNSVDEFVQEIEKLSGKA
ncbi:MAG: transcriptional repressor NrdR [Spirochaetia bacterium]|nr:transcriptional repressor NrdR [Spirochaetia bacterium]MBQ3647314.1 transcriptional repressor NrdR [Spirochaetia bacterium]MBQ3712996.1 transcriptional repressor NrdR [Spirochaetia bacterium]MBQ6674423.1 transcriptional repressor NrdR [Spirochaetia bacterium]MBR0319102.1 transcriptional repressor NrdR [Spirochaetia bacterium]